MCKISQLFINWYCHCHVFIALLPGYTVPCFGKKRKKRKLTFTINECLQDAAAISHSAAILVSIGYFAIQNKLNDTPGNKKKMPQNRWHCMLLYVYAGMDITLSVDVVYSTNDRDRHYTVSWKCIYAHRQQAKFRKVCPLEQTC